MKDVWVGSSIRTLDVALAGRNYRPRSRSTSPRRAISPPHLWRAGAKAVPLVADDFWSQLPRAGETN